MLTLHLGNCLDILGTIKDNSIDAIISDPPYPEVTRDYGRISVDNWFLLMKEVIAHSRRVLKPNGSAMFLLQPNSSKVGSIPWFFEFVA